MNQNIKKIIRLTLGWFYRPILNRIHQYTKVKEIKKQTLEFISEVNALDDTKQRVFYLGITNHANLGDMAQHFCINKWISKNYPKANVIKVEADTLVYPEFGFLDALQRSYREDDIIIFQSGYTTQDLGGCHELMHRLVIDAMPNAKILMMPQTIYFRNEENRKRTSTSYNKATNMLFLARDMVSYDQAINMFPSIKVMPFPDIVTSLIGTLDFTHQRNGVCLCVRDDTEKYYTDNELKDLQKQLQKYTPVTKTDTTINVDFRTIRKNLEFYIKNEIEKFSTYDVTITDRYHGTIFSLAAGTPVIIIKTNDHKVITGADWFKGVYDDYVYVATDLEDAMKIYHELMKKRLSHKLNPYFGENYYDKLKGYFSEIIND